MIILLCIYFDCPITAIANGVCKTNVGFVLVKSKQNNWSFLFTLMMCTLIIWKPKSADKFSFFHKGKLVI